MKKIVAIVMSVIVIILSSMTALADSVKVALLALSCDQSFTESEVDQTAKIDLEFTYETEDGTATSVDAPHKYITLESSSDAIVLNEVVVKSVNGNGTEYYDKDTDIVDDVDTNPWPAYIDSDGKDISGGKFLVETYVDETRKTDFESVVLTATYTIPAGTKGEYTITATADATDYTEADYADVTADYTLVVAEKVVEPELDSSIVFADTYANLGATLGINFEFSVPTGYDSAYVEIDRKKCNSSYDFDDAPTRVFDSRTMEGSNGIYTITYDGIALYETTIPARAVIYLVKNDVAVKKSDVIEISLATLIKNRFANAGTKSKALYADILKIGTAAQDYFIAIAKRNGNQTPDLEGVALPTDGISVDAYGATSYSLATEINLDDTGVLSAYIGLDPAPGLIFDVTIPSGYSAEDLTLVSTYTSNVLGETPDSVKLSDITPNNSVYTVPFSKIALYDSNKLATASLVYKAGTDEEAVIATTGCSVESYLGTRISSAGTKSKVLYEAIAKLGVSARDYFSALYKITV